MNNIKFLVRKEDLINTLPKETINFLPIGDSTLLTKINFEDLEKLGLSLKGFELICSISTNDEDFYIELCNF